MKEQLNSKTIKGAELKQRSQRAEDTEIGRGTIVADAKRMKTFKLLHWLAWHDCNRRTALGGKLGHGQQFWTSWGFWSLEHGRPDEMPDETDLLTWRDTADPSWAERTNFFRSQVRSQHPNWTNVPFLFWILKYLSYLQRALQPMKFWRNVGNTAAIFFSQKPAMYFTRGLLDG